MICPKCKRLIPNKTHLLKNGCKWCDIPFILWDQEWDKLLKVVPDPDSKYLTPSEFISKVYYYLSYKRGFPGWETKFVKQIKKSINLVKI